MNHREIAGLMAAIAPTIGDFVGKAMAPLRAENARLAECIQGLEQRFASIPSKEDSSVLILRLVEETVAKVPPAPAGANGKDADPALVAELVDKAVAALEPAKDGAPGPAGEGVTVEDLEPLVKLLVTSTVAASLEDAIASLPARPAGEPGKSVTVEDVAPLIAEQVAAAVAGIRVPEDGKSVTADDVRPLLDEMVTGGFEALPKLPTSFMVNEAGELVAIHVGGETKLIGQVRGADGARGASVMDGEVDGDGVLAFRMSDGRTVKVGIVRGEDGKDGAAGALGPRGRDAMEVQILPGIDESRSYSEGICSRWRGGIIRSERQTDAVRDGDVLAAGWGLLLEGIAEEQETSLDEGRFIERTTTYTSGRSYSRKIKTATPIDRGVWKEAAYEKGDGVTWAGSFFIAQRDTEATDKPQNSDAWRLSIKRGRDGADGRSGSLKTGPVKV